MSKDGKLITGFAAIVVIIIIAALLMQTRSAAATVAATPATPAAATGIAATQAINAVNANAAIATGLARQTALGLNTGSATGNTNSFLPGGNTTSGIISAAGGILNALSGIDFSNSPDTSINDAINTASFDDGSGNLSDGNTNASGYDYSGIGDNVGDINTDV